MDKFPALLALGLLCACTPRPQGTASQSPDRAPATPAATEVAKNPTPQHTSTEESKSHAWSYKGESGPQNWSKTHADCGGQRQSPINIIGAQATPEAWGEFKPDYKEKTDIYDVTNNGHSVQFTFEPGDSHLFNGERYNLQQIHFHEPAEHTLNGVRYPIVIHLVHASSEGKLLVFAVFAQEGESSAPFSFLEEYLPLNKGQTKPVNVAFSLPSILPKDTAYYYYQGSLTTPPCTEKVDWIVFKNPITISAQQVEKMRKSLPDHNFRPEQPVNARKVVFVK